MPLSEGSEYSDVLGEGYVSGEVTVGTSAVEAKVGGSVLSKRELLYIENKSSSSIFYGPSGVTTTTGAQLKKDQFVWLPVGESIQVFMIRSSGSATVIVQEFA